VEKYTIYNSAMHALCVIAQAHFGIPEGLDICEALFDEGPVDGGCDAVLLAALLTGVGLDAEAIEMPRRHVAHAITDALLSGRECCFQVDTAEDPSRRRWAVVTGSSQDNVFFAVCVGADDDRDMQVNIHRHPTGQVVRLVEPRVGMERPVAAIRHT
jgi:hypothetical protein